MLIIRLSRCGIKKRPFYKIIVADQRCSRDGRFIERLGYFNPFLSKNNNIKSIYFNLKKVKKWIKNGAKMSKRVSQLIKNY